MNTPQAHPGQCHFRHVLGALYSPFIYILLFSTLSFHASFISFTSIHYLSPLNKR
ncbi:hypothetical protein M422DRAFT_28393 [Sphaerobolus stellatus SS14]|uniref:Unplaced genomic scaffold SPHSTscaffold_40, whole genome shotgun sequence n=1 Tax=Sphaerobolus stellatus (strain SS14) TaxID=990650 RepID=A0A0C9UPC2_SPHS4|nr:hypothetical protein M422DRAFT_30237 [Sphaerobolus stellatus SS14]KIJ48300.1 hypothetical protein M422DRAFT_28393 [Sphaerobolus stellatus SS14]